MGVEKVSVDFGGRPLSIETGRLAKQAGGSALVQYGDTIVLVAATVSPEAKEGINFLPLTVIYQEKTFAAGKIPGGFFKREGRPSEFETLTSRFIDRPVRPLFPKNFYNEMQVIATVLSADLENEPDVVAMVGSSAALMLSDAPFQGPIAGVRVGRSEGQFIANPTPDQLEESDIDLIVAGSEQAIVMVEGGSLEVSEEELIDAVMFGHQSMQPVLKMQSELAAKVGKAKIAVPEETADTALIDKIKQQFADKIDQALRISAKQERSSAISELKSTIKASLVEDPEDKAAIEAVGESFKALESQLMRQMILKDKVRVDGRKHTDIRQISCETALLPRAHGSALFTRGETQALVAATLGSESEAQRIDTLTGEGRKRFMLHYNFPPFCVGEVRRMGGPGRREIGHGALAERAVRPLIPVSEDFPYTIRVVSEILESNGSSSMATVCGASLAMMDAGIQMERAVAGIAMGLVKEDGDYAILSDILGDEDHVGDMDFKVTGTERGITALQMDVKIKGLSKELLSEALAQAREGRLHILSEMAATMPAPRAEMPEHAPRLTVVQINPSRIRDLIGPGGKNIKGIVADTGAKIDVDDDGRVQVFATTEESRRMALARVEELTASPEMGKIYQGRVEKIMEYGAFVQIMPGCDGLLHISQIDFKRIDKVEDVLHEGDVVPVKVIKIEPSGKVSLSRIEALKEQGEEASAEGS